MDFSFLFWFIFFGIFAAGVSVALLTTSVSDLVSHGEDMVYRRRCINCVLWTLLVTGTLLLASVAPFAGMLAASMNVQMQDLLETRYWYFLPVFFAIFAILAVPVTATVFIVIAHRKMREVSLHRNPTRC